MTDDCGQTAAGADPAVGQQAPTRRARLAAWWEQIQGRLRHLDAKVGPLLGYERASEFGKLLVPAWWVLRGYLAAMVVVTVLDRGGQIGLLPRLGGSDLAGLMILAAFVTGSVWLAHREARLDRWRRRAVYAASALVVLFGFIGFLHIDSQERRDRVWTRPVHEYHTPYQGIKDIFPIDQHGRPLTNVRLFDQNGDPIEIGWNWCDDDDDWSDQRAATATYPRCPARRPSWSPEATE